MFANAETTIASKPIIRTAPYVYKIEPWDESNLIPYDEAPLLGQDGIDQQFVLNLSFFQQTIPGNEQYRYVPLIIIFPK